MKKRILIACQLTDDAEKFIADLERAGFYPKEKALVLCVADVIAPPLTDPVYNFDIPEVAESYIRSARAHSSKEVARAKAHAKAMAAAIRSVFRGWKVEAAACADSPPWAIIKKADSWKADLVVLGSRGLPLMGRVLFGSTSQKVAAEAHCSVRILHKRPPEDHLPVRLLIGFDGSHDSQQVIDEVAQRKWKKGSSVHILSLMDHQVTFYALASAGALKRVAKSAKTEKEWLTQMCCSASRRLQKAGLQVSYAVKEGDPKTTLIKEAHSWGADTIFVGARGLRGLHKFLIGSVSGSIAAAAHCSVEIVRP